MAKKSLEEQIKVIGFWVFSGVFLYLVISFFLLSDYPIQEQFFNHKKAYEVIKDALGLAAAFLAPVTAFVLFSDWRVEHKIKSAIQLIDDLNNLSLDIKNGLGFYYAEIILEKDISTDEFRNREDRQKLLWQLIELKKMKGGFLIKNEAINIYEDLIVAFDTLASKALNDLHIMEYFSFNMVRNKFPNESEYNRKNYVENSKKYDERFKKLTDIAQKITEQAVCVKKSIL